MATAPSSDLDFDSIKQSLIDHMKSNPTFTDYNFQGSALSAIMDILALNTHTNAVLASMAHAENFLDSAQKRSSVVSRAKEMGYTPRSAVCSTAYVDITAYGLSETSIIMRGTTFKSSNENGGFVFSLADNVTSKSISGGQIFQNAKLVCGTRATNSFKIDTSRNVRGILTIPNKDIDTSTLKVYYRESPSAVDRIELALGENVYETLTSSKIYFLQESYDGFFQIYFGNNVIGFQPPNGSVIEIDYFVNTKFSAPNGCNLFSMNGTIATSTSVNIDTKQVANSGAPKEDIDSIKQNAKRSNSAKERAVSSEDFELAVRENFDFIKSVSVWGGEDNVPPVYGKVFISVQPVSGFTISDTIKRDVMVPRLRKNALMTVIPVFVDPEYLLTEFITTMKYNPSKSTVSLETLESYVRATISSHIESISTFNSDYIESTMIGKLLEVDSGVSGVSISKRVGFRISPLIGVTTTFSRGIYNSIKQGTIKSTKFKIMHDGSPLSVIIKETGDTTTTTTSLGTLQTIADLGVYSESNEKISKIGTVNLATGHFDFELSVHSYLTGNRFIQIMCELNSDDIISARNQIVILDSSTSEDGTIGLVANNAIITEYYEK